jgi:hypothetical protein
MLVLFQIGYLCFILQVKPYNSERRHKRAIVDELTILTCLYCTMLYTEYLLPRQKYTSGYFEICLILFVTVWSIGGVLIQIIKNFFKAIRLCVHSMFRKPGSHDLAAKKRLPEEYKHTELYRSYIKAGGQNKSSEYRGKLVEGEPPVEL